MSISPYDSELFRRTGHQLVDLLADYLAAACDRRMPVLPEPNPRALASCYQYGAPSKPTARAEEEFLKRAQELIAQSTHLHHPGYIAHQVAPPLPLSALADLLAGVLNQSLAVYEMSPAATHIERQTVRWLCALVGWDKDSDGVFTSGGSLGNLTALLAARNRATDGAAWERGVGRGPRLVIIACENAHYSVARAAGILGLGQEGAIRVPMDARYAMDFRALEDTYRRAVAEGSQVVAVVASAASTATGSFDPLRQIGAFCHEKAVWLHVDAAHGASVLLSEKYKYLADGLKLADSIVWDAHKLLYVPSLATAVLFRRREQSYAAFRQHASYLFDRHNEPDLDLARRTVECTKRMLAWKLWIAWQIYGTGGLGELVTRALDLGRTFAAILRSQRDFELLTEPMTNIVCFRYRPAGVKPEALSELQTRARRKVLESGEFFLVQTPVGDAVYLRTTIMNPNTSERDFFRLLELIRECSVP